MFNKTKIVATVGPASNSKEVIKSLVLAGVDVFRLNFSHGTHAAHKAVIDLIHEVNDELDTHVGILADLQGPKIRLGEVDKHYHHTAGKYRRTIVYYLCRVCSRCKAGQ